MLDHRWVLDNSVFRFANPADTRYAHSCHKCSDRWPVKSIVYKYLTFPSINWITLMFSAMHATLYHALVGVSIFPPCETCKRLKSITNVKPRPLMMLLRQLGE